MGMPRTKRSGSRSKAALLRRLSKRSPAELLELLGAAYEVLDQRQRGNVFGQHLQAETSPAAGDGQRLLREIRRFHRASRAGEYYAPFMWDSKTYRNVPPETEAWFDEMGKFLLVSTQLAQQGQPAGAVACFRLLYELIEALEDGDEIVFAHELGSWMIPVDERKCIAAYLRALAAIASPEEYAAVAVPLIKRDSHNSFADRVYAVAMRAANKAQKTYLAAELERQRIPLEPDKSGPRPRVRRSQGFA
jgi:hypothetical protein